MITDFLLVGLGLAILLLAGDALVRGAVNMSLRLGVPALIVSLTIVAFGTSAPELLISIEAILDDAPGIALGNVVGSNIANVLMVLGIPALLAGLHNAHEEARLVFVEEPPMTDEKLGSGSEHHWRRPPASINRPSFRAAEASTATP